MSVVLPALNESATVGEIVSAIRKNLVEAVPLVDEIVVIDPGSVDGTAEVAMLAGARVEAEADILPGLGRVPGKGEALWKSLHATSGELVVFVDADLEHFDEQLVTGLLGPLLTDPGVQYVKASYERPLAGGGLEVGAGRVTELVARPLLNAHWPALAGVAQPLSGEYAGRRDLLERLPFVSGYGVEFALLVDTAALVGVDAIAQVDVGRKIHEHQSDEALGRMAAEIMRTAWWRLGLSGDDYSPSLVQFRRDNNGLTPWEHQVNVSQRPPMVTVEEYVTRRRGGSGAGLGVLRSEPTGDSAGDREVSR